MKNQKSIDRSSVSSSDQNSQQCSNSSAFSAGRRRSKLRPQKIIPANPIHTVTYTPPAVTTLRTSPPLSANPNIISLLQHQLCTFNNGNGCRIPQAHIVNFYRKLYPVEQIQQTNTYISLYRALVQYMAIMFNKYDLYGSQYGSSYSNNVIGLYGTTNPDFFKYTDITKQVYKIARNINQQLAQGIKIVLDRSDVRDKIIKTRFKTASNGTNNTTTIANTNNNSRKQPLDIFSSICLKPKVSTNTNSQKYNFDFKGSYKQDPSKIAEIYFKQQASVKNLLSSLKYHSSQNTDKNNRCIICQKQLYTQESKPQTDKSIFKCEQCLRQFHKNCNPRQYNCIFCQLRNMNPLKQIRQQLFVGILKKNTKKHEINFKFKEDPNQMLISSFIPNKYSKAGVNPTNRVQNIQIRSLRVKDHYDPISSYNVLFPDACSITVNGRLLKQFIPLHRQSSLKYRRDEPIKLVSNINLKKDQNNIKIVERFLKKQLKIEERVQIDNHLLGIYILKQPMDSPKKLVEKYQKLSFAESEKLLKQSLLISSEEADIACETTKISLKCSLTLLKMNYPGRGIFCKHFTCFDILNYILLNSQLTIPKWQCPICRAPAYDFRIDPIMSQILAYPNKQIKVNSASQTNINNTIKNKSSNKKAKEIVEVIFDAQMNFWYVDEQSNIGNKISIYDLPIISIADKIFPSNHIVNQQSVNQNQVQVAIDKELSDQLLQQQLNQVFINQLGGDRQVKEGQVKSQQSMQKIKQKTQIIQSIIQDDKYKIGLNNNPKQTNLISLSEQEQAYYQQKKNGSQQLIKAKGRQQQYAGSAHPYSDIYRQKAQKDSSDGRNDEFHCDTARVSKSVYNYDLYANGNEQQQDRELQQLMKQQQERYIQKQQQKRNPKQHNSFHNQFLIQPLHSDVSRKNKSHVTENMALYGNDAGFTKMNSANSMNKESRVCPDLESYLKSRSQFRQKQAYKQDRQDIYDNQEQAYKRSHNYNHKSYITTRSKSGIRFGQQPASKKKNKEFVLPDSCQVHEISD